MTNYYRKFATKNQSTIFFSTMLCILLTLLVLNHWVVNLFVGLTSEKDGQLSKEELAKPVNQRGGIGTAMLTVKNEIDNNRTEQESVKQTATQFAKTATKLFYIRK